MTRGNGGSPEQLGRPPCRIRGLVAFVPLLLIVWACVPGEGPRPPSRTFAGSFGRGSAGIAAPAGGGAIAPPPGTAGVAPPPPAGTGGVVAGMGLPPAGRGGAGTAGPVTGGTGGAPMPLPDGGLPEFDGGSEPGRNMVRVGQICQRFTTLQCAGEAHCCSNPGRTNMQCRSELMNDCMKNAYLDQIAENQVSGFSPTHAEAFFTKLEGYASNCDPTVSAWIIQPDGLLSIYQGTVAPSQQCRPTGFASLPAYGAALASCTQSTTHACLFTGNGPNQAPETATCAVRGDVGATCFVHTNCKDGLYCANPTEKYSAGRCTAMKAVGTACGKIDECTTQTCLSSKCAEPTVDSAWCF